MLNMMRSINLQQTGRPNWEAFVAYLANYIGAEHCNYSFHSEFPPPNLEMTSSLESNSANILKVQHIVDDKSLWFAFSFTNPCLYRLGQERLATVESCVETVLQLAVESERKQCRQHIAKMCVERAQIGLLTLDEKGTILDRNHIIEPLLHEGGMFSCQQNQLLLNNSPKWFENQIEQLELSEHDSICTTLKWQNKLIHCILSNALPRIKQRVVMYPHHQKQQFLLMVYMADTPPSITFLQQLYSLSEAEALIVSWFSLGLSAEHVAEKTGYTVNTVYSYIKKLYATMSIHKQSQLTALVWQQQPL
ncbi:hypothetical protein CBF23_003765 [Marinomonas agarivorans]|nr:hypothetical protein CBF23_003765 [Marinomonas agarivorans]